MEEEKNKAWLDEDGIVNIRIAKIITPERALELTGEAEELLLDFKGEGRVFINIIPFVGPFIATPKFRRDMAEKMRRMMKGSNFKKVAICGGNITIRTIVSFIIAASRVRQMKVFSNKEDALKWLKEP